MSLTKQDIDALVDNVESRWSDGPRWRLTLLRSELYLAAGLTAEGERKPARVRCYRYANGAVMEATRFGPDRGAVPGWFVPDGEAP